MMRLTGACLCVALILTTSPAFAYLKLGTRVGDRVVSVKWSRFPVRYFVTDRGAPGVSSAQLQAAVARAFTTWQNVPSAAITFQFFGLTSAEPQDEDGMSTLGFANRPELERTLGATSFLFNTQTGDLIEADIFFNSAFAWSVEPSGEAGRFDLESIAVHEIGHLLGLGHSAIGETELQPGGGRRVIGAETVMFPIAFTRGNIDDRTLRADDVAGVSDLYPDGEFLRSTGSIVGRVTKDGRGVFGAHVVAFNPRTGTLVGNFSLNNDGEFVIAGLEPGPHTVRVEPLDDGDIESFFSPMANVALDFRATFLDRFAIPPRGGGSERLEVKVAPK